MAMQNSYMAAPLVHQYPPSVSTPVIHAPFSHHAQSYPLPNSGAWTTGLYNCCDDCSSCCVGYWCPCVLVGRSVEVLDEGATCCCVGGSSFFLLHALTGCGCLYTSTYRTRLRHKYGLPQSPCNDCCTDCFCLGCSVCQVYRELKNRHAQSIAYGAGYPAATSAPDFQYMTK